MTEVSVRDLRNHGGDVLDTVMRGESVTVTRQGKPVAELRPIAAAGTLAATLLERWGTLSWSQALQQRLERCFRAATRSEDHAQRNRHCHRGRVSPGDAEKGGHHVAQQQPSAGKLSDGGDDSSRTRDKTWMAHHCELPEKNRSGHPGNRESSGSPQTRRL